MKIILIIFSSLLIPLYLSSCAPALVAGATTGAVAANDQRTIRVFIDDAAIEAKTRSILSQEDDLAKVHINITSINGVVLLTGEVLSSEKQALTLKKVGQIHGVRRIVDELRAVAVTNLRSRAKDTWLTGKVKTSLISNDQVDSTHIKVVTANKTVYLMGLVSQLEARFAANSARKVKGISRVVKLFEYID